jgi:hypothetical protein
LLIHQLNNNQKIAPTQGKTIFFKSELWSFGDPKHTYEYHRLA